MGTDMDRCIYGPVTRGTAIWKQRQVGLQPQGEPKRPPFPFCVTYVMTYVTYVTSA